MTLKTITQLINGNVITGRKNLDVKFEHAFATDLMSDVLAYVETDSVIITGLANIQVIKTAFMLDLKAVVFVRGKMPNDIMIKTANEYDMTLVTTPFSMYTTSGLLFKHGLMGTKIE